MKHDLEIMRAIIENIISHDYVLQYVLRVQACLNSHKIGRDILDDPI